MSDPKIVHIPAVDCGETLGQIVPTNRIHIDRRLADAHGNWSVIARRVDASLSSRQVLGS